jgi:hypothetical protein
MYTIKFVFRHVYFSVPHTFSQQYVACSCHRIMGIRLLYSHCERGYTSRHVKQAVTSVLHVRPYDIALGVEKCVPMSWTVQKSPIYGSISFCFTHDEEPLEGTWLWFQMRSRQSCGVWDFSFPIIMWGLA